MAKHSSLTVDEIRAAFADPAMRAQYPPVLSPAQLAELLGVSRATVYLWIQQGRFQGATTRVGKHRRLWRDTALERFFDQSN